MAVPVGHGCSRSDQPQWNYKDLKNCHNVWPPFQPSNPSNPTGEMLSKVKSKLWFQLSERAPPRTYKRWSRRFILFSIQVSLKENYEAAYIHQTNLNSESFLFYCFFRNSPAPASAERRNLSKLLPVVDRDDDGDDDDGDDDDDDDDGDDDDGDDDGGGEKESSSFQVAPGS